MLYSFYHFLFWFPVASVVCAGSVCAGFVFVRVFFAPLPFLESFVIPGTTTRELISVLVCATFFPFSFLLFFCFCRLRRFRFRRLRFHWSCLHSFLFLNLVVALQENLHCIHCMFYTFLFAYSFLVSSGFCRLRRFRFHRLRFHRSCLRPFFFLNLFVLVLQDNLHMPLYVQYSFYHFLFWFPVASVVCAGSVCAGFVFVRVLFAVEQF